MPTATDSPAYTYGWDTVFAIRVSDVNRAIEKAARANPTRFPQAWSAADVADGCSVAGTFGVWSITAGGDGDLLRMAIPFSASLTLPGAPAAPASGIAHVDVRLQFLHDAEQALAQGGAPHHLKVRPSALPDGSEPASVIRIVYAGSQPSFLGDAALSALLGQWLNANLSAFDHVFATVDLAAKADRDEFQWMQPTDVAYAYSDATQGSDGIFAVLGMSENRSSAGLVQQVSSAAIPAGQRAGLLISKQRMLGNLMLPHIPQIFPGATTSDFKLSASGDSIVNATANVSFHVEHDKKKYASHVTAFSAVIDGNELQVTTDSTTDISPGIRSLCHSESFLSIELAKRKDGAPGIAYRASRPAINDHHTVTDPGFLIAEIVLGVIAVVAALVATVLTGGAATVALIAAVTLSVGAAAMEVTVATIAYENDGAGPDIGPMVLNATAAFRWPDAADFTLGSASLNESLQLGGDPHFTS